MRVKILITLFIALAVTFGARAQSGGGREVTSRILILLDKSSSMINVWDGGRKKSKVADEIVLRIMDSVYKVNPDVEFSLRVFGHQSTVDENNCRDTRNEVPFRRDNRLQMEYRLDDIQPLGVTSIAYALQEAADNDLVDVAHNAYSIILITDGGESCGGDICAVMAKLAASKVFFRPYIVNLESSMQLRTAYACMGDYLEVTRYGDLPGAVSKIVNAFRPVINVNQKTYTEVKEVAATAPTVMNVTIPVIKVKDTVVHSVDPTKGLQQIAALVPATRYFAIDALAVAKPVKVAVPPFVPVTQDDAPDTPEKEPTFAVTSVAPRALKTLTLPTPVSQQPRPTAVGRYEPQVEEEVPARPAPEAISKLNTAPLRTLVKVTQGFVPVDMVKVGRYEPVLVEEVPPRPDPITIARLQTPPKRLINLFVLDGDGSILRPRKVPPMPPLKFDDAPAAKPAAKPVAGTPKPLPGKPAEFKVETEDAEQTTVQIYFTNGKGKFYTTTPQIMLLDPYTGDMVKRFYRMVDGDGNPDPQLNIQPGTYNLTFSESRNRVVNNLVIEPNKKNKVYIVVNKASLSFEYVGAPNRPVKEFSAVVTQRNRANGTITQQKCTDKLEYEPENYHVEINTFPLDIRNIDLDFDESVIRIPQPGFAKFVAEEGMNSVTLYEQFGDKYRSFSTIKLSDPVAKHLQIQPGKYEAHYHKGPGGPNASEKVVIFLIKATEETVIELK